MIWFRASLLQHILPHLLQRRRQRRTKGARRGGDVERGWRRLLSCRARPVFGHGGTSTDSYECTRGIRRETRRCSENREIICTNESLGSRVKRFEHGVSSVPSLECTVASASVPVRSAAMPSAPIFESVLAFGGVL